MFHRLKAWIPWLLVGVTNILLLWAVFIIYVSGLYGIAAIGLGLWAIFNAVFLHPKLYAYRYLFPTVMIFLFLSLYPLTYTIYIAFTNLGTGHIFEKEEVTRILTHEIYMAPDAPIYYFSVIEADPDHVRFVFSTESEMDDYYWISDALPEKLPAGAYEVERRRWPPGVRDLDTWMAATDAKQLGMRWLVQRRGAAQALNFEITPGRVLSMLDLSSFGLMNLKYLPLDDGSLQDQITGAVYAPNNERGFFQNVADPSDRLNPGYKVGVGFYNFYRLIGDPAIVGPILHVFAWTFAWAIFNTFLAFAFGMLLAVLLSVPGIHFKRLFRLALIVPYAIPFFVGVLIFSGMMNEDFGVLNHLLQTHLGISIPWLNDAMWAKISCLFVGLWLGYPYMMLINTGALQAIPDQLYEAAAIDGASAIQKFRLITMPSIMPAVAPLLVGTFAFNFNNFVGIYLLTGGGPPIPGAQTPAGSTDILMSYIFKLAFGGAGNDFGLACALSIIVFFIIAGISLVNFKIFGMMKDVVR